uniref:Uncharacterized protein n=1 Tax=viral metagenome TaxID=1070528 RepID=A0A6C0KPH3_9ZZZZ
MCQGCVGDPRLLKDSFSKKTISGFDNTVVGFGTIGLDNNIIASVDIRNGNANIKGSFINGHLKLIRNGIIKVVLKNLNHYNNNNSVKLILKLNFNNNLDIHQELAYPVGSNYSGPFTLYFCPDADISGVYLTDDQILGLFQTDDIEAGIQAKMKVGKILSLPIFQFWSTDKKNSVAKALGLGVTISGAAINQIKNAITLGFE